MQHLYRRHAMTLIELLIALALIGILASVAIPHTTTFLDAIDVHGAANDAEAMLSSARHLAIVRAERTVFEIDTTNQRLTIQSGGDTLQQRDIDVSHGVSLHASRSQVIYSPRGVGVGVSNVTMTLSKGAAAETLRVSRLGRVNR